MSELNFLVQGSAADPYEVTFRKDGDNLTALCTCPAGMHGKHCKHRFAILDGSTKGIVSDNLGEVKTVEAWLSGSDVEEAVVELRKAEKLFEVTKKDLSAAKKKVARVMRD